ncbi:MAG: hypothetical protein E8D41_09930 [Nitrospira sp.]|nr:MAG: hypothetical protein E8D41_09930 [Nitrospira sp.]
MDEQISSGGLFTASGNPALDTARAEFQDIATNTTNPRYAGYQRGDRAVSDYLDGLYKKALPDSSPVTIQEGVSVKTGGADDEPVLSPDDARAMEALRHEWGGEAAAHWADAQVGISRLTRTLGGEVDDLVAAVLAAGGDLRLVTNIARHFGKQARTYAP